MTELPMSVDALPYDLGLIVRPYVERGWRLCVLYTADSGTAEQQMVSPGHLSIPVPGELDNLGWFASKLFAEQTMLEAAGVVATSDPLPPLLPDGLTAPVGYTFRSESASGPAAPLWSRPAEGAADLDLETGLAAVCVDAIRDCSISPRGLRVGVARLGAVAEAGRFGEWKWLSSAQVASRASADPAEALRCYDIATQLLAARAVLYDYGTLARTRAGHVAGQLRPHIWSQGRDPRVIFQFAYGRAQDHLRGRQREVAQWKQSLPVLKVAATAAKPHGKRPAPVEARPARL